MPTKDETDSFYIDATDFSEPVKSISEEEIIRRAVVKLNGHILGFVIGTLSAVMIFVATNWLVLKGGDEVGPHMSLLGQFLIGYSVTFAGSIIGAAYLFVIGYLCGLFIAWVYNWVVSLRTLQRR
jgi:ABC-type dipeptide/oligopeptide/nickel transport system permease subunit